MGTLLGGLGMVGCLGLVVGCTSNDEIIKISEFMASNANGLKDGDGETSDWIEIFNAGQAPVDLEGWRLTDDPKEPGWAFPEVSLGPGQYLVVFAAGKPQAPGDAELHASFRLKAAPDFLAVMRRSGRVVHQFAPYPEQFSDVSYGLGSNGVTGFLATATPGEANGPASKKRDKPPKPAKNKPKTGDDD
jgi:hypothetical protein